MKPPLCEWRKSSGWIETHMDCIERVYVALVRECEQVNALTGDDFSLSVPIEGLATFLQECATQNKRAILPKKTATVGDELSTPLQDSS